MTHKKTTPKKRKEQKKSWLEYIKPKNVQTFMVMGALLSLINAGILLASVQGIWADEISVEICFDQIDNDGNGVADCADPFCFESGVCTQVRTEVCSDGEDNDYDGRIDCMDNECNGNPACPESEICGDGMDNDLDGYIDCADDDCSASPVCPAKEICDDTIDNDENGAVDCEDESCTGHVACTNAQEPEVQVIRQVINRVTERVVVEEPIVQTIYVQSVSAEEGSGPREIECSDGKDNDGNGSSDCSDANCISHPDCIDVDLNAVSDDVMDGGDA